jgi:hypothetical protein
LRSGRYVSFSFALCKQFYEFIRFQFYRAEMMIFFIGKEEWRLRIRMEAKGKRK